MYNLKKFIKLCMDLPKSIYFNFKVLPIYYAFKLPIRVNHSVKLGKLSKNCIEIKTPLKIFMIRIGDSGSSFVPTTASYISVINGGKLVFKGSCVLGQGSSLFINKGKVEFGDSIYANKNLNIQSEDYVKLGNNVLIGWNVQIRDTDGHPIIFEGKELPLTGQVIIDDRAWIASDTIILKGSEISRNSVVGCRSLVCGYKMSNPNCLLAGTPAIIKKENITWKM